MKKRALLLLLVVALIIAPLSACGGDTGGGDSGSAAAGGGDGEKVVLTMGSWRADDVANMNNLLAAYAEVAPNVEIKFEPTNPSDYNATLRVQLEGGTGPDLMYARSYQTGAQLFSEGYFADCSDLPGLKENFTEGSLAPWTSDDGKVFAVPFAAVSHAVYYNKDVFAENELEIPETWEDFIALCAALKEKGITPLANGVADEWDALECFFLTMLPNYIGGASEREKYESGEKPLNDPAFVEAYAAIAETSPYLPEGFEAITYNDSQALFLSQGAAMFMDGSWTCEAYRDKTDFEWGVFAAPAPEGQETRITFHPDLAITMNAATTHPEEAQAFLAWLCTEEGASAAARFLPAGYFPLINFPIEVEDPHANEFLALNEGKETDVRFVWPKLMDYYAPMNQAVISVLKGEQTPQEAADSVANFQPEAS